MPSIPAAQPQPSGGGGWGNFLSSLFGSPGQQQQGQQSQAAAPSSPPPPPTVETVSLSTVGQGNGHLGVQTSFDFSDEGDSSFVYPQASSDSYVSSQQSAAQWSAAGGDVYEG